MAVKELSDKGPDGTRLGQSSTDLISFYGQTPAARTSTAQPASTAAVSVSATQWGFSTSTQANAIVSACRALASLGLIPES